MEDAVLDDNRNEITSDNNNDKKDFPKWGPSHSASDDETQDDDDNHKNNHNNQNNKKMILSSMKLFKSSQQQQQQQQQRSTSNSSYSNRTHPSNTNSTSTAPTAPITTSTNANVRRNNHNSLALKTGMQSPHTPNTNDTNINNDNNTSTVAAATTTTTTTSMGGAGAAATNFWNFNVRSYDEEGADDNNNNNDATIVIKSPTATSTATHTATHTATYTPTATPTPTATMNPTTPTGNNNTSSSPLLSSPAKAAADAVKGMIDSLTQQVNQASAKAQEMKLPSFTMPNINMNSMNINMNMNSVTMAGVGLGAFCGPSSNHGNNNNSNNNLDETMDDTNKTSFSTFNNNSNSNYTSSPRTTTVGKKTKSILGKIPEDFGFCGDQSSNATNNNNNGCMIMDGGDDFIGGMMNFIDGDAGGRFTGRGGGIHLHHGNDHEEEIVDIDNEEDGIINNYDTPTANTTTITTTAPMSPERDKGYEIRLKSTFSLLELKHQKEQKKKEKMMSSARQQQQQQQQQMMKKKKPFPTLPELPMDDIMEGDNNDPESHCVNNNKAASRKSGGGRRSPTLSAFGRTHPNNKSQQQQHQQQHYMDPSSSQHTPQDLSQGGLPFEFLTVPTGKDVDLERSVSELTMRSHGAYDKHRYSSDSRRMAYYAVGRVNNLDSNDPNNNAKGGNRRCYFTGISIPYGMPFYAGSVQQGPRTLVVFCLPSALGLPSLHPQPLHRYSKTDRERYLQTLPESNDALIEEMKRRYSESFDTLPVQVKSPHCWRLFVKFCFFSGLPIAEGEMHYRVKNSVMVFPLSYEHQQQQHVLPSSSPGPSSSPTSTENKSKSAQPSNAKGDTNDISSTPSHTMHKEEIALSHEVLEAINGEASAEILRLPNQKTFDYLKRQYSQQSAKLNDDVFDRKSWEIVLPEV